jgi:hypothetical protein
MLTRAAILASVLLLAARPGLRHAEAAAAPAAQAGA